MRQLALFPGAGKDVLFSTAVRDQFLTERQHDPISDFATRVEVLQRWIAGLESPAFKSLGELEIEAAFNSKVLVAVLGYRLLPDVEMTAWPKPNRAATRLQGTPDLVLGDFKPDEAPEFQAVVELKAPGTDLDKPQPGHNNMTPVEQAFDYGRNLLGVRWVLVSDMRFIRLYSIDDPGEYESFDLVEAANSESAFRKLWWLLSFDNLIRGGADSVTSSLHDRSSARRLHLQDGFYDAYWKIRVDLYQAVLEATRDWEPRPTRVDILEATQRLLDRVIFILYCEDHPQRLIKRDTLKDVVEGATRSPGAGDTKVYEWIKQLFKEVDAGSPASSGLQVPKYNGELFKPHPILDRIDLPDSLSQKRYSGKSGTESIIVRGVWGLHRFDFYGELGEHMLGRIFEESLSDLEGLGLDEGIDLASKLSERKRKGVFYTSEVLADYLADEVIQAALKDAALTAGSDLPEAETHLQQLTSLRIIDPACGSGAFLVACYRVLLDQLWKWRALHASDEGATLLQVVEVAEQASLLRDCIYGVDLLDQAVDIAKLALWLRSVRKGERVSDLSRNIVAGDSLYMDRCLELIGLEPGSLDIVIGNPPWGGEMEPGSYRVAMESLGLDTGLSLDSWEVFVLLGLRALKPGGRLAFVLPDSLLYPEKRFVL